MATKENKMAYKLLYTFLKENGILVNYIENVIRSQHHRNKDVKLVLMELVCQHGVSNYGITRQNLFNYAPTSFYWHKSIEGESFWQPYFNKWMNFFENNKEKYNLS